MDTLKMQDYIYARCVGCGNTVVVSFLLPKYVLSAPEIACSKECLARYEVSMEAFLERQVRID